ncbi:MAG: 4Fe-4S dicluster domain-containing protein [Candidatus Azobacteroides sp.]|nr:4Fe-4S dicluster domain-containing protein [Candidatus Azobacteroides sp.]
MIETAKKLLKNGDVNIVIGYSEGSQGRVRPFFARNEEEAENLVYDNRCTQNLAMYVSKKEISKYGKPAIVANIHTLRGIIRLAVENQIKDGDLIALHINDKDEMTVCSTLEEIETHLATVTPQISDEDKVMIEKLDAMSLTERRNFWEKEMENCIKCYACRQACPLCYCTQCTVEVNQPQWIPVEASIDGNLEWHIMRAMHLSGRCISCGQCGDACPVGIPIHLLPMKLSQEVKNIYGSISGMNRSEGCAMATYQPGDKENFIG